MNDDWESGGNHLASWVVRLSAKGEALRGQRRSDLRQVAIVTCAKSAAEIALFNEQKSLSRRNIGLNATPNHQHITRLRRKRFHSSGHTSSTSSTCSSLSMDWASDSESYQSPSSCSCNRCSHCRPILRKQGSVLRSRSPSPSPATSRSMSSPTKSDSLVCDKGSWDDWDDETEETKLIDEFLASLSSYECVPPSSKRQKRLWLNFIINIIYITLHINDTYSTFLLL